MINSKNLINIYTSKLIIYEYITYKIIMTYSSIIYTCVVLINVSISYFDLSNKNS